MFFWAGSWSVEDITKLLNRDKWTDEWNGLINRWLDGLIETSSSPVPVYSISSNNIRAYYNKVMITWQQWNVQCVCY